MMIVQKTETPKVLSSGFRKVEQNRITVKTVQSVFRSSKSRFWMLSSNWWLMTQMSQLKTNTR